MVAMNTQINPKTLIDRYVAVWHEPEAARRRAAIESIWSPDGEHLSASKEARGYDQLEQRIADTYQRWVVEERCSFRALDEPIAHHDAIRFRWEMVSHDGQTESIGLDLFILNDDGSVARVYQFIEQ